MEEDAGVKVSAPVTRLRRRLSVEQSEESKSPAVNTPTKKRGGRRAKPELDLIDENTPDNTTTTRRAKKTATKEIKDTTEEKPVTPSRRSTRIKSNTSIVSETAISVDSPRAKRAARRTSAVGSDSEAPATPIRQTRRTRKDSASSLEKVEVPPTSKPVIQITEVIEEEPETNGRKSISNIEDNDNTSPNSVRKSPRLLSKSKTSPNKNTTDNEPQSNATPLRKSLDSLKASQETQVIPESQEVSKDKKISEKDSITSSNLIRELDVKLVKLNIEGLNKSTSALEIKQGKSKRKRTKSWTKLNVSNESNFFSDNESTKKKLIKNLNSPIKLNKSGSGDASVNTNVRDQSFSKRKKSVSNSFIVEDINPSLNTNKNNSLIDENKDLLSSSQAANEKENILEILKKDPISDVQASVFIENDSDLEKKLENEDQCVPVVKYPIAKEDFNFISKNNSINNKSISKSIRNDSCEPMDVDETIPESLLVEMQDNENNSSKRHSITDFQQRDDVESNKSKLNKSKRKSSITSNLEKSNNENKSTLILSQLKDTSSNDIQNAVKSPHLKSTNLSKTVDDLNVTQENEVNKKNVSLNCVTTSTPLQQKSLQKLALNVNTSLIAANDDSKNMIETINIPKKDDVNINKDENSSNDSIEEENHVKETSNFDNSKLKDSDGKMEVDRKITNEKSEIKNLSETKVTNDLSNNLSQKPDDDVESVPDDESLKIKRKKKPSLLSNKSADGSESDDEADFDNEADSDDDSQDTSKLLDDKAEDAGDDYESGDSQDENEREYAEQNEILEKGETLTSEEDFSDDSDYEKDSFVVSSAEEDNELLDGTDDDLSMSDNELRMSAKSKKKFNERKLKEQKEASREMYESRHKLNTSKKTNKKKSQQISASESDEETEQKPKKKNRMRLDSTNENSMLEDKDEETKFRKIVKRLSTSICEEGVMDEKEITIANESIKEDPLRAQIKDEPKTPQKENMSIDFVDSKDADKNELTKTQTEIDPLNESMDEENSLSSDTEIMNNYDSVLESLGKNNKIKAKTCDTSLNLNKKSKKQKAPLIDELNLTQIKSVKKSKNKPANESVVSKKVNVEDESSSDSIDLHLLFSEDSNQSEGETNKDGNKEEEFIPLKRKDGKTDITQNDTSIQDNNTSLNVSSKKNKKRKSNMDENVNSILDDEEGKEVSFFIDTEGMHTSADKSLNTSSKNKKKAIQKDEEDSDEAPTEISFQKEKREDKIDCKVNSVDETDLIANQSLNKSIAKTPISQKKKKKARNSQIEPTEIENNADASLNVSLSGKKKKISIGEVPEHDAEDVQEGSFVKTPTNQKKKKHSSESQNEISESDGICDISLNKLSSNKKKKKSLNATQESQTNYEEKITDNDLKEQQITVLQTPASQKKKKNKVLSGSQIELNDGDEQKDEVNKSVNKTPNSKKKKKPSISIEDIDQPETSVEELLNVSKIKTPGSLKKAPKSPEDVQDISILQVTSSKKRKRSLNMTIEEIGEGESNVPLRLNDSLISSQKKKLKISQQSEEAIDSKKDENVIQYADVKKKKKSKKQDNVNKERENPVIDILKVNRNKRKYREDDDEIVSTKALSQNSFEKKVPRLPSSIINQLDDNPQREIRASKKAKLISTTEFVVEETRKRRNKPSNYLEESVYLNDDETENKKLKKRLLKPKVLPFVPTALTSGSGYTTNFKVNVIPKETKFVAQSSNVPNFKQEYLNKKIKRQGTYELYKRNRNIKISKF